MKTSLTNHQVNRILVALAGGLGLCGFGLTMVPAEAEAGCVSSTRWRDNQPAVIPVFVFDDPVYGLNESTIGLDRDRAAVQIIAAIQAWNDAGTGAPRLVFAGFRSFELGYADHAITVASLDEEAMKGTVGLASTMRSSDRALRVAILRDDDWVTDPGLGAGSSKRDLQAVLVHEFGHSLGLGHPWLAAEFDLDVGSAARNSCGIASGPKGVTDGSTVGVMHYLYRLRLDDGWSKYPRDGTARYPWRDDIEAASIAASSLEYVDGQLCESNAECVQCPPSRPSCDTDRLVCARVDKGGSCTSDVDCDPNFMCERGIGGIFGTTSGLEACESDAQCNDPGDEMADWTRSCDLGSGKCVALQGACVERRCSIGEPRSFPVAVWFDEGSWDGPYGVPTGDGLAESTMPVAVSAADNYNSRRVNLVTVNAERNVEYHQALDGGWCSEIDDHVVLPGPEGRTWARPAAAVGGGRTMVAWLSEGYRSFDTTLRFAIRDTAGTGWDDYGSFGLPGYNKAIGLGYVDSESKFALTYIDDDMQARVRLIDPVSGTPGDPQIVVRTFIGTEYNYPIDDISRPACSGDRCTIAFADGNEVFYLVDGEWDGGDFTADDYGDPGFFIGPRSVGLADNARRGPEDNKKKWFTYMEPQPLEAGRPLDEEFILGGGQDPVALPWTSPDPSPGLDLTDFSPAWSAGTGTYAGFNPGDSLIGVMARGLDGAVLSPGASECCTEAECGPPPPEEDPAFLETGCDPLDEGTWGEAGCPCRPIETSFDAVEDCSLAGFGPAASNACQPIHPDGSRPDKYCIDGSGDGGNTVVCGETPAGNHICQECGGGGGALGCPCDEVDCEFEDLSCWGSGWGNPAPDDSLGRCWEPQAPPEYACIEVCDRVNFFDDAFKPVCVGPHLDAYWSGGTPYNFTMGPLAGHPAYCTTVSCTGDVTDAGYCEELNPGEVCVAEDTCGTQCLFNEDCYDQGYPEWYVCAQNGVNLCLPLNVCDVKPEVCG